MPAKSPEKDIPSELVFPHYKFCWDMYLRYDKMSAKQDMSYFKYTSLFMLAIFGFVIMYSKGILIDYRGPIAFTGFGVLLMLALSCLCISSEIDWKRSFYEQQAKGIEDKYQSTVRCSFFQKIATLQTTRYWGTLLSRLWPFALVGISTVWSSVILAAEVSLNLSVVVGFVSSITLIATMWLVARSIKRNRPIKS